MDGHKLPLLPTGRGKRMTDFGEPQDRGFGPVIWPVCEFVVGQVLIAPSLPPRVQKLLM